MLYNYQISVALNGKFMFRTDWIDNERDATNSAVLIKSAMPLASVSVSRRDATRQRTEVTDNFMINWD